MSLGLSCGVHSGYVGGTDEHIFLFRRRCR
ncbi:unnamed protein product [Hydatigera taeniaeformis]|uniref:Uncharacterized protein n=1 Tax=Hydatigena taeniaeformis TaxID=6205 RepID=A0A0R3XDN2_HYDTA|nr:unnamed protein product [Hydatigera taeniaeformis]